ncbi:hypothetical protein [Aquabacterium sp. OR-4]|uniref:hypothetical protein n=1 Tax=Aquabacterium sp. OR-4 TaxID=2978127 RepID=UPI0028C55EE8|nr:hypothetical protein [Aquabacterium sp. OR-4]MDT7834657.1 hypothetical protein [Aquabacterium sp. OR-4]
MQPSRRAANPFALMLDPQAVLAQIEHSERLERLQRRVCRPLDRPLLAGSAAGQNDVAAHDRAIDDDASDADFE